MGQARELTFLDEPPHRATTKELKALGMVSRRRTLAKKAEAVGKHNPSPDTVQSFLDGVQKLSQEQRPVVFLDCLHNEHFPLLDALITQKLTGLPHKKSTALLAWGFSQAPLKKNAWPLLQKHGGQKAFFKNCLVVPDDLPFSGWQWIGNHYKSNPEPNNIFDKDVTLSYSNFQAVPHGQFELAEFGNILRDILKAFGPKTSKVSLMPQIHNIPRAPKVFVQNPTILMSALISGWSSEVCAKLYPHITMVNEGIPAQTNVENRFLNLKSAHDWLRLQKEIQSLSEREKDEAVATIHLSQGQGAFGGFNAINVHGVLSRHPVTKKLFNF